VVHPSIKDGVPSFFTQLVADFDEKYRNIETNPDFKKLEVEKFQTGDLKKWSA
jgi:hypothetical protein